MILVTLLKTANELLKGEYIHSVGLLSYDAVKSDCGYKTARSHNPDRHIRRHLCLET